MSSTALCASGMGGGGQGGVGVGVRVRLGARVRIRTRVGASLRVGHGVDPVGLAVADDVVPG